MSMKKCSRCKEYKDYSDFTKNKSTLTGYSSYCKQCNKEYDKQWRDKNPIAISFAYPAMPANCVLVENISGFENIKGYCIDIIGTIYSCKNSIWGYKDCWNEMKIRIDKKGYPTFSYFIEGKRRYARIHRMLATYYIPLVEGKTYINHKDGNRLNNSIENLEWCNPSENIQHSFDKLGHKRLHGTISPAAKLTETDIPKIRELLKGKVPIRTIGKVFGVHGSIIQGIKQGKRWAHVT